MSDFINKDYPKRIKHRIRELAGKAYERELSLCLQQLDGDFSEWRRGFITTFELVECIHNFHDKRSRELYKQYQLGEFDAAVANALAASILSEEEVEIEVKSALKNLIGMATDRTQ
ncbi:MAG: hypothetical protein HY740_00810 [Chloroflexi bacterium]|nr:hypothetical protein [Chloroflexota bacterium]